MTTINHAATGALVAVAVHNPWVGLPAAFVSHFVIDVVPHWDYFEENRFYQKVAVMCDLTLTLWMVLVLALTVDAPRRLIIAGAALGPLPDLMWAAYWQTGVPRKIPNNSLINRIRNWHLKIQTKEFPNGIYIEIAWLILVITLIYHIHR